MMFYRLGDKTDFKRQTLGFSQYFVSRRAPTLLQELRHARVTVGKDATFIQVVEMASIPIPFTVSELYHANGEPRPASVQFGFYGCQFFLHLVFFVNRNGNGSWYATIYDEDFSSMVEVAPDNISVYKVPVAMEIE